MFTTSLLYSPPMLQLSACRSRPTAIPNRPYCFCLSRLLTCLRASPGSLSCCQAFSGSFFSSSFGFLSSLQSCFFSGFSPLLWFITTLLPPPTSPAHTTKSHLVKKNFQRKIKRKKWLTWPSAVPDSSAAAPGYATEATARPGRPQNPRPVCSRDTSTPWCYPHLVRLWIFHSWIELWQGLWQWQPKRFI